jgi:hypothetical protein
MSKELIGTSLFALNTQINLKIPVAESFLPVQSRSFFMQTWREHIKTFPKN